MNRVDKKFIFVDNIRVDFTPAGNISSSMMDKHQFFCDPISISKAASFVMFYVNRLFRR